MHKPLNVLLASVGLAVAAALLPSAFAAPPQVVGPAFPQFATADALKAACDQGLLAAKTKLRQIERRPADGRWLAAYDAFSAALED